MMMFVVVTEEVGIVLIRTGIVLMVPTMTMMTMVVVVDEVVTTMSISLAGFNFRGFMK